MSKISRRKLANYIARQLITSNQHIDIVSKVAAYLVYYKRTRELELLVRDIYVCLQLRGIVCVKVITKNQLSNELKSFIKNFVISNANCKTVLLDSEIDTSLSSGMILKLPDAELNTTSNRKLQLFKYNNIKAMKI